VVDVGKVVRAAVLAATPATSTGRPQHLACVVRSPPLFLCSQPHSLPPQIREKGFHAGRDEAFDALVLDEASEDKLLDELEPAMAAGGNVVEFHSVDFFPERWFDLVLVLRTDNTTLFDRLTAR
jgi:hypothetical protein